MYRYFTGLYTVHLYNVQCTMYNVQLYICTMYSCTVYNVQLYSCTIEQSNGCQLQSIPLKCQLDAPLSAWMDGGVPRYISACLDIWLRVSIYRFVPRSISKCLYGCRCVPRFIAAYLDHRL